MKKLTVLTAFILALLVACQNATQTKGTDNQIVSAVDLDNHPGKELMATNCYSCHAPGGGPENRIAPPMHAVKMHYKENGISKEEFVANILAFHKNPVAENSKMPNAIEKFGIMPKFGFPDKDIEQIAEYMFLADLHKNLQGNSAANMEGKSTAEIGLSYAMSTKQQLGKNLMSAIKTEGTPNAIAFCNVHAYPITDSLAKIYNLSIKRVTDKPRNSSNLANEDELAHIETFKNALIEGKELESIVSETDGIINFYYPIITNDMCLQCHGEPNKEIDEATLAQLNKLYPDDKAKGYAMNQVRGIWSISWEK